MGILKHHKPILGLQWTDDKKCIFNVFIYSFQQHKRLKFRNNVNEVPLLNFDKIENLLCVKPHNIIIY